MIDIGHQKTLISWIKDNDVAALRTYFENPAYLLEIDRQYYRDGIAQSLIIHATAENKPDIVELLIDLGADVNAVTKSFAPDSALKIAVERGCADITQMLLKAGATFESKFNRTLLHIAVIATDSSHQRAIEVMEVMNQLLSLDVYKSQINEQYLPTGFSALHYAVTVSISKKDPTNFKVIQNLMDAGININLLNKSGRTAEQEATHLGNHKKARFIKEYALVLQEKKELFACLEQEALLELESAPKVKSRTLSL